MQVQVSSATQYQAQRWVNFKCKVGTKVQTQYQVQIQYQVQTQCQVQTQYQVLTYKVQTHSKQQQQQHNKQQPVHNNKLHGPLRLSGHTGGKDKEFR